MHCNDLLSRLRACLAAALLAAALVWLTAAAFLPEESCLLPVLTAAAVAGRLRGHGGSFLAGGCERGRRAGKRRA